MNLKIQSKSFKKKELIVLNKTDLIDEELERNYEDFQKK